MQMKKTILLILLAISVAILAIRLTTFVIDEYFQVSGKAGIRISSIPDGADVEINGKNMGKTPFENLDLKLGETTVKLKYKDIVWQKKIEMNNGTVTMINRDLSSDPLSQAGEVLSLTKGSGVSLLSFPDGADVEINGKNMGKTPLLLDLSEGDYTFLIKHNNYLNRSIKAVVLAGFRLILDVDLAITETDLTNIPVPVTTSTAKVVVKSTPTGFLRVRDKPSISGKQISQVKPGDELILLEELSGWYRIRLLDGNEGYISSSYVDKKKD